MANKNDLLSERLKEIQKEKEEAEKTRPDVVQSIVTGEEEKPDFVAMAAELEAQKEDWINEDAGFVKDTIYIRSDLFKAMKSLCAKQGDKKKHVNAAYELYLTKIYKEMMEE